jgi:hypothetical protein
MTRASSFYGEPGDPDAFGQWKARNKNAIMRGAR